MRRALLLVSLLASSAYAGEHPILGGMPAMPGQFPTTVAIDVGGGMCTGTLLTKDWVLTAAHCVTPMIVGLPDKASLVASIKVHFNTVTPLSMPGMVVMATDAIPDPGFDVNTLGQHDSGLIKLATPVTTITPVPINWDPAKTPVGTKVTMVGFGQTMAADGSPYGTEYVVDQTTIACATAMKPANFPPLLDANLLCFDQTSGKGKCHGDSGGPSFAMIDGKQFEVGVTSFGDCPTVGADTRTDAEKAFLIKNVKGIECLADNACSTQHECFQGNCIVMPFSPGGLGATCTTGTDCDSGTCAMGDGGMKCTMACTVGDTNACPAGLECKAPMGTAGSCWPAPEGGGCCDASGAGAPTALACFALGGLVLRRKRR